MPKKILIVDDEKDFCDLLKKRLEFNKYNVLVTYTGESGIELAKQELPDVILMDVMLPNMSGGDAVRILKSDSKTSDIPVIFLTAVISPEEDGMGSGINIDSTFFPAIGKPFNPDDLLKKIKIALAE